MVEGRLDRNGSTFGFGLLEMDRCKYALFPFRTKSIDTSLYEAAEIDGANRLAEIPLRDITFTQTDNNLCFDNINLCRTCYVP